MKIILKIIYLLSLLPANQIYPGLSAWFSADELSCAGGSSMSFNPTRRNVNLSNIVDGRLFSTSYVFYPVGIQAQSASITLPIDDKNILIGMCQKVEAVHHIPECELK